MAKTLTLRLDSEEEVQLDTLIRYTGQKAGTKALIEAMILYPNSYDKQCRLKDRVEELEREVVRLNQVCEKASVAARSFLEEVGQLDMVSMLRGPGDDGSILGGL